MWFVWSSGSSVPYGTLSSLTWRPMRVARPRTIRWGCAARLSSASARRAGSRRSLHPSGAIRGGSFPRSIPRLLASPLPSSTFDVRPFGAHRGPRGPYDRGARHVKACARDPPDLDADSPVASRSMRSDLPAGLPLLGLSKDRPSIVPNRRVRLPGSASPRLPSGRDSQSLPRSVLVVSHHLDGSILFDRAGLLRPAPDPGVHRVSSRRETGLLTVRSCPSKLSLRRQQRGRAPPFGGDSVSAGPRHGCVHRWTLPSPRALPPHPSLRAP
jgi:hypothetical protein